MVTTEKEMNLIKKKIKLFRIIPASLCVPVLFGALSSCGIARYRHKPYILHQGIILFEDIFNNLYFEYGRGTMNLVTYDFTDEKDHCKRVFFEDDDNNTTT